MMSSCTYTNLTQSQKQQGYPHSHFAVAVLQERKKYEKMTSTQLECLYTDQHSTRVLTQQTSKHLATVLTQQSLPNEVILCIPVFIYSNHRVGTEYAWSETACGMRKLVR